jgi:glycosyltransferase involved in cell wall biosynthesis
VNGGGCAAGNLCPRFAATENMFMSVPLQSGSKPSICFVALNAYPALSRREDVHHIGGAEVQQLRIARWLVRRGHAVSFVTLDHGQPDGVTLNDIRVFKAYAPDAGIRGLRFISPRWSGLGAAMARADADLYYQRTAGCETGQVALWCRLHRRKFIFAAASDSDCDVRLPPVKPWRERLLYRLGVKMADVITTQTTAQQRMLRENMGLASVVIRNCGGASAAGSARPPLLAGDPASLRVLWVGRISEKKRFEWFCDVAERCPDIPFDVVGTGVPGSSYARPLLVRAAGLANVKMHGYAPYVEMPTYYRNCHVLCCTSPYEGFPNTFLEAWAQGIPVVSTFDPDGVIAAHCLGWVAREVDGLVRCLRSVIQSPEIWRRASGASKQYYQENHTPEACLPRLERLLQGTTAPRGICLPSCAPQPEASCGQRATDDRP